MRRAVVDSILFKANNLGKEVNITSDSLLFIPTIVTRAGINTSTTINIEAGSRLESVIVVNKSAGTSNYTISFSDDDPETMTFDVNEINEFVVNKNKKNSFSVTVTVNSGLVDIYVIYLKGIYV